MSFCSHDFYNGVVIVTAGRMNRHSGWFIDYNHLVLFVDDLNWLRRYRRLVSVQRMRDDVSVLNDGSGIPTRLAINRNLTCFNRMLVVLAGAVAELCSKDVQNFATPPS